MLILYRVELSKSSILTTFSKSRKINKKNLLSTNCETLFTPPPLHTHTAHLKPALSHILIHTISLTMIWSCPKFDFLPPALSFDAWFCTATPKGGQARGGSRGVPRGLKPPLAPQNTSKPPLAHQMLQNVLNKFSIYLLALEMTLIIWYIKKKGNT